MKTLYYSRNEKLARTVAPLDPNGRSPLTPEEFGRLKPGQKAAVTRALNKLSASQRAKVTRMRSGSGVSSVSSPRRSSEPWRSIPVPGTSTGWWAVSAQGKKWNFSIRELAQKCAYAMNAQVVANYKAPDRYMQQQFPAGFNPRGPTYS